MSVRTSQFRFGPVRQDVGDKHVRVGDLAEAINVRQTKEAGVYAKRKGFARTAQTFVGGTLSGGPLSSVPGVGGATLMRDRGDQLWSRSPGANSWIYRGKHSRPWPTVKAVSNLAGTLPQPFSCMVGSNLWIFALKSNGYEFSILDASTGTPTGEKVSVTATNIAHASAVYADGFVWVFWVAAGHVVYCHKIDPNAPTAAPAATTFYTLPVSPTNLVGVQLRSVAAKWMTGRSQVFVVAAGGVDAGGGNFKRACAHAVLDAATGTAVTSGGQAPGFSIAFSGAGGSHRVGGVYILDGQDSLTVDWYYSLAGDWAGEFRVWLVKVAAGNLASFSAIALATGGNVGLGLVHSTAGFHDPITDRQIVLCTRWDTYLGDQWGTSAPSYFTEMYHRSSGGAVTSATDFSSLSASWIASGFARTAAGRWYALTGFDDFAFNGSAVQSEAATVQRCYHVREFSIGTSASTARAEIQAQFAMGDAPAVYHRPSAAINTSGAVVTNVPTLHLFGSSALLAACALRGPTVSTVNVGLVRVDLAKTYGRECQAMGRAFSPGSIPIAWNESNAAHEVAPLLDPGFIYKVTEGTGSTYSAAAVLYAIYDSDQVVWRSAPFFLSATIGAGAELLIPNPVFRLAATSIVIEVYLSVGGGVAKLQGTIVPAEGAAYSTWATGSTQVNGDALYTTGGALEQAWPVACQAVGSWRNRVFLAQENRLWASKELEAGLGPLWNESQVSTWAEETDEITAMAPIDWNYCAVFSASRPGAISGAGPDGLGNGNYQVLGLRALMGVLPGGIAQQGPGGCYWQDSNTGRIIVVTPGLEVTEAAGGAYDYASMPISASAWYDAENLLVFASASGKAAIVMDYQHTNEAAPFGQCYLWTFAWLTPIAAGVDAGGFHLLDTDGSLYRPGGIWHDEKPGGFDLYARKLTTAPLQFGDLQGELEISRVQVLVSAMSACGVKVTTIPNYAGPSDPRRRSKSFDIAAPTFAGAPANVSTRPAACARVQALAVSVEDAAAIDAEGFDFEGVAVEFTVTGRLLQPNVGKAR